MPEKVISMSEEVTSMRGGVSWAVRMADFGATSVFLLNQKLGRNDELCNSLAGVDFTVRFYCYE